MEKTKLPKHIADKMVNFEEHFGSVALYHIFDWVGEETAESTACYIVEWIRKDNFNTYYTALVNGYEVEQEPEDKVRDYYNETNYGSAYSDDIRRNTIRKTIDLLGIKIEGVNT